MDKDLAAFYKTELTPIYYVQVIPLLGVYPKEMKTCVHKKICLRMFITAFLIIDKKKTENIPEG